MVPQLTTGYMARFFQEDPSLPKGSPVLQIIEIKKVHPNSAGQPNERARMVLSDGQYYCPATLSTQMSHMIGQLEKFTVIKVQDYLGSLLNTGRKIVIILNLEVLSKETELIGNPSPGRFDQGKPANPSAAAAPQQQTFQKQGYGNNNPYAPQQQQQQPPQQQSYAQPQRQQNQMNYPQPNHSMMGQQQHQQQQPQQQQQFQPQMMNAGMSNFGAEPPTAVFPISTLNPYQTKWTIKVKLFNKRQPRTYRNQRGEGRVMSVDFRDESGGEIRCTMFNQEIDKFDSILNLNGMYYVSKGSLRLANKQFSPIKNDYELTLNSDSIVIPITDDHSVAAPQIKYTPISELANFEKQNDCNVIGIVTNTSDIQEITSRKNKQISKRTLTLVDQNAEIQVTLWEEAAQNYNADLMNPVVSITNARVSDFNGCSLNSGFDSSLDINPDIPEAHTLRGWWNANQGNVTVKNLSTGSASGFTSESQLMQRKFLSAIKDEHMGYAGEAGKPTYFTSKGTVMFIRHDGERPCWYTACPSENCKKKVIQEPQGWRCETCNQVYPNCRYMFILSCNVHDHSGSAWIQLFDAEAQNLLGKTAEELNTLKEHGDPEYEATFMRATFTPVICRCRAKLEQYNDQESVRISAQKVTPIDFATESSNLIKLIQKYDGVN